MKWTELYEKVISNCSQIAHADNIIGHWMDESNSYEWNDQVPEEIINAAKAQKII